MQALKLNHTPRRSKKKQRQVNRKINAEPDSGDEKGIDVYAIDFLSRSSIDAVIKKCVMTKEYEGKWFNEQLEVLIKKFTPTEIRPIYGITAHRTGATDPSSLGLDNLKTMKKLAPAFVKLIVDYLNAMEKLDDKVSSGASAKWVLFCWILTFFLL